jgi:radical SAM enzyme (TIGR01210 family)
MDLPKSLERRSHSADRPYAVVPEREATLGGRTVSALTVFLTAAECPVGCHMCDLWQNTLSTATPPGAITRQIEWAVSRFAAADRIKLYNSGNFFDRRSIPVEEYSRISELCMPFSRVVVENHPRIGRRQLLEFRDRLATQLEVAVGLETVQPRWLERMGKRMSRDDFDRYARWLSAHGVDLRVFLIVGVPRIGVREAVRWARLSVRHALAAGARHISLIPARSGHGWNGLADQLPSLEASRLAELQIMAIEDAGGRAVITVDLWGFDPESRCDGAGHDATERIAQVNASQTTDVS